MVTHVETEWAGHTEFTMIAKKLMSDILREEAEFADSAYAAWADHLDMSETMFRKYSTPQHRWDKRQFSAMLLGELAGKILFEADCALSTRNR